MPNVFHYTTVRVLSTVTPPHRVLLFSEFAFFAYVFDNTNTTIYPKLSTGHRSHLPHTTDAPEQDNHWRKSSRSTVTSGNSSMA